jgi:hypothetical protein
MACCYELHNCPILCVLYVPSMFLIRLSHMYSASCYFVSVRSKYSRSNLSSNTFSLHCPLTIKEYRYS